MTFSVVRLTSHFLFSLLYLFRVVFAWLMPAAESISLLSHTFILHVLLVVVIKTGGKVWSFVKVLVLFKLLSDDEWILVITCIDHAGGQHNDFALAQGRFAKSVLWTHFWMHVMVLLRLRNVISLLLNHGLSHTHSMLARQRIERCCLERTELLRQLLFVLCRACIRSPRLANACSSSAFDASSFVSSFIWDVSWDQNLRHIQIF